MQKNCIDRDGNMCTLAEAIQRIVTSGQYQTIDVEQEKKKQEQKEKYILSCQNGDLTTIKELYAIVDHWTQHSGFHEVMMNNHVEAIRYMLSQGSDPNQGWRIACIKHSHLLPILVEYNGDIEQGLSDACEVGNRQAVDMFLQLGAKNYQSALNKSCRSGDLELVKKFIALDSNLNIREASIWATTPQSTEVLNYLASLDPISTIQGSVDFIKLFLGMK